MDQENIVTRYHLSLDERYQIQHLLDINTSIRKIAKLLNRSPSTILREIKRHTKVTPGKGTNCVNKKFCKRRHVCGNMYCRKACKNCTFCKKHCSDYVESFCEKATTPPYLCNGCRSVAHCSFKKQIYRALCAEETYKETLITRRNGFDLTYEQLEHINSIVSPLIKQGQSPYHIIKNVGDQLNISESTLRRLINANELDVINLDLRTKVKMKPRNKDHKRVSISSRKIHEGHLYKDYLEYIKCNDVMTVQMDCVEGIRTDNATLLTLHFPVFCMQIALILDKHTSSEVVRALDKLEEAIGCEMFRNIFEVIRTDNGREFMDVEGMDRSINGGKRTTVFFCEPNRSDEKGSCENNHKLIRYILPKGSTFEPLTQSDVSLMMNHINSYARKSLYGKSPYQAAMSILPEDFFIFLGLREIAPDEIMLKPSLLKNKHLSK